jgi:hypothetical protein
MVLASQTALNVNLTFAVHQVTSFISNTSGYGMNLNATAVSGSAAVHNSGLGALASSVVSVDFAAADLTTGFYAMTVLASGSIAGSTTTMLFANLEQRHIPV